MVGGPDFAEWMPRHGREASGILTASAAFFLAPILVWYAVPVDAIHEAMFHAGSVLYVATYLLSLVALDQWRPFRRPGLGAGLPVLVAVVGFLMFFIGDFLIFFAHDQFAAVYDCSTPNVVRRCQAAWHWHDDVDQFVGWLIFAEIVCVPIGALFGFLRGRRYQRRNSAPGPLELDAPRPAVEPTYSAWSVRARR